LKKGREREREEYEREEMTDLESNKSTKAFDEVKEVLFGGIIVVTTRHGHVSHHRRPHRNLNELTLLFKDKKERKMMCFVLCLRWFAVNNCAYELSSEVLSKFLFQFYQYPIILSYLMSMS